MDAPECRDCEVGLERGGNWYDSDADAGRVICTDCRRESASEWREENYARVIHYRVKYRAKKRGIPFDLDPHHIVIPNFCPVLGIPIQPGSEGGRDTSPSLDRKDPDRGYLPGNVQVISNRANTLKNNASSEELRAVAAHLREIERRNDGR